MAAVAIPERELITELSQDYVYDYRTSPKSIVLGGNARIGRRVIDMDIAGAESARLTITEC
jgi:predicted component of type VI protein secretion system